MVSVCRGLGRHGRLRSISTGGLRDLRPSEISNHEEAQRGQGAMELRRRPEVHGSISHRTRAHNIDVNMETNHGNGNGRGKSEEERALSANGERCIETEGQFLGKGSV